MADRVSTYVVGPMPPAKKKQRKEFADKLAHQLMKLLTEDNDYDVFEITAIKFGSDDE